MRSGRGADIATVPCPQACPTVAAERSSRNPNWHIPLPRQNTMVWPRRSTDLTKAAVRPPKFLHGIPSTLVIPNRSPNPGARHEVSRAQPFPRGASLDLWHHTLNLYSVYVGCSLKMPLRGEKSSPSLCRGHRSISPTLKESKQSAARGLVPAPVARGTEASGNLARFWVRI